jgi:hypothetical protein
MAFSGIHFLGFGAMYRKSKLGLKFAISIPSEFKELTLLLLPVDWTVSGAQLRCLAQAFRS